MGSGGLGRGGEGSGWEGIGGEGRGGVDGGAVTSIGLTVDCIVGKIVIVECRFHVGIRVGLILRQSSTSPQCDGSIRSGRSVSSVDVAFPCMGETSVDNVESWDSGVHLW